MTDPVAEIAAIFSTEGASEYLGEAVTQAEHMRQAGTLARSAGASDALVAAALLHDVGHFERRGAEPAISGHDLMAGTDNHHSDTGAAWLSRWFGEAVTEPVRLHVQAKRYLCATEPDYFATLSPASVYTLGVQGGPMSADEVAAFEAEPYAKDAVTLRRWDEAAKEVDAATAEFADFETLLRSLLK